MKKKIVIAIGIMAIIILGLGGKMYMDEKKFNEDMVKVVYSTEAKKVFEDGLKNLDPKALTDEGVIQSYEIDKESIKHNPMGGVNITLFVNENIDLNINFTLSNSNGTLESGAISYSGILADSLEGNSVE